MGIAANRSWMTRHSLLAIVLLGVSPAAAEADPEAAAEALFRSGREAAADGDHAQACQRFRESQRLQPAAGTLLNLAICEEQLGQLVEAWQHYHAALDSLPDGDSRREISRARLAKLDARLPRFVVQKTASAPPRTRVRLGRVVFNENSFGVPIPVNPGTHAWVVSSPGRAGRTYTRQVAEGERFTLRVEPGAPLPEPNGERAGAPARSGPSWLGYSLIGVGAASLAVSGVTALMALDRGRTVEDECSGRDCTREGQRAADQGGTLVTWCTVSFVFGLLGAGSGTYLVLSGSSASSAGYASARFQLP